MILNFFKVQNKPTINLHIGMNKTGTSALQSYFISNKKMLLKKGVLYPSAGLIGSAHYSLSASLGFANPSVNTAWIMDKDKLAKSFKSELTSQVHTVIFSSEDFVLNKPIVEVKKFFKGYDVKIIVYLRRHDHWWLSAYAQAVKMKHLPPWKQGPQAFINFNGRRNKNYGKYKILVDRWAEVFGKQNVIVRPYETEQNKPDLAYDFLTAIGQECVYEHLPPMSCRENSALPLKAIQYMDIFQRVETEPATHSKLMKFAKNLVTDQNQDLSFMLNPSFRRKLIEKNLEDYQYIAREYLGRDDGALFFEKMPVLDPEWKAPVWPTHAEVASEVIKLLKAK